eukprot:TRINITY_DN3684_c0_g1_i1.p2 TRINITY_DN3684_c0_g1~~TRINITY_DN3684_c0_g1_i1.p2  ORF type:complete len:164 (+),score=49.62 TRINITY_DN3684_c0_g1_i1:87-578(+)
MPLLQTIDPFLQAAAVNPPSLPTPDMLIDVMRILLQALPGNNTFQQVYVAACQDNLLLAKDQNAAGALDPAQVSEYMKFVVVKWGAADARSQPDKSVKELRSLATEIDHTEAFKPRARKLLEIARFLAYLATLVYWIQQQLGQDVSFATMDNAYTVAANAIAL